MFGIFCSPFFRLLLLCVIGFLQYHLWFSGTGLTQYFQLRQQIQYAESDNNRVDDDNHKLNVVLDDLHAKDGRILINNAREGLGMVGPDETLYQVVSD